MATLSKEVVSTKPAIPTFDLESFAARGLLSPVKSTGKASFADGLRLGENFVERGLRFIGFMDNEVSTTNGNVALAVALQDGPYSFGEYGTLDLSKRETVWCQKCHEIHGDNQRSSNEGKWNVDNLALSPLFIMDKKVVVFSRSCVINYILPAARKNTSKVVNLADLETAFAPIIKAAEKRKLASKRSKR